MERGPWVVKVPRLLWLGPLLVFIVSLLFFGWLFGRFPVLYDTDSYYHLAIGRVYAHEGPIDELPWARFSLMRHGFGDKEFLFHLLLVPFAGADDPASAAGGGRWALAFFNALVASALALLGILAVGRWGLAVPWLAYAGSADFLGRMIRLRPELLSLLLLLAAIACVGARRDRLLGLVTALYTLGYTAFHALLGLAGGWFAARGWTERRWSPALLLYPVLGAGVALLVHPNFPHNLAVWKVQSIDYFARKADLNVGREIGPALTSDIVWQNLAWAVGLLVLWRAARRDEGETPAWITSTAWALHVATAAFGLLYALMQRFSIYFIPLATLSLIFELRRRGYRLGASVALPGRGRLPLALALALVSILGLARTGPLLRNLAVAVDSAPMSREDEWTHFGRAVPPGARVAAEWGSTHIYMFWAPQGMYLNVLDPVFMAQPFPRVYAATRAVFEGREPDVPLALEAQLDSNFLAVSGLHPHPDLLRRLRHDPRLVERYPGYTLLYEAIPDANADFVLDWRQVPPNEALPALGDAAGFAVYPRASEPRQRALEGFVDAARLGTDGDCAAFVHDEEVAVAEPRLYELASYGPATLWLDGEAVVGIDASSRAILGAGLKFPVRLEGRHRFTVQTCRGSAGGPVGFYLRRVIQPDGSS